MPKQGEHVGRFSNWNITLGARAINARSTFHQFHKDQGTPLLQSWAGNELPRNTSATLTRCKLVAKADQSISSTGKCKRNTTGVWSVSEAAGLTRRSLCFRRSSASMHQLTSRTRESHFYIHWWSNDAVVCLPTWCIISRRTINQRLQSTLPKAWRLPRSKLSDERSTYNYDQDCKMIMAAKTSKSPLIDD